MPDLAWLTIPDLNLLCADDDASSPSAGQTDSAFTL